MKSQDTWKSGYVPTF